MPVAGQTCPAVLVEAAWHHRKTYRNSGLIMRSGWKLAPPAHQSYSETDTNSLSPWCPTSTSWVSMRLLSVADRGAGSCASTGDEAAWKDERQEAK
jgi:hypothetical protein